MRLAHFALPVAALALAAAPAAAQWEYTGPAVSGTWSHATLMNRATGESVGDQTAGGTSNALEQRFGLAYSKTSVDAGSGRLTAVASGGYYTQSAFTGSVVQQRLRLTNTSGEERTQTFESYLHAVLSGSCTAGGYWCPDQSLATVSFGFTLFPVIDDELPGFTLVDERRYASLHAGYQPETKEVFETIISELTLAPGESREYVLRWAMNATAFNAYTADGGHTGSFYIPPVAGITLEADGDFLSRQSRPDWVSSTTAPEPASVALLATGLVATGLTGLGARRRRRVGSTASPAAGAA